jgi:hypothetical protein
MNEISSDRQRIHEFKRLLIDRLLETMDPASDTDGPVAIAALGELTAEFSCAMLGKELTLYLLDELATQVDAVQAIAPPGNGISRSYSEPRSCKTKRGRVGK